MELYTRYEVSRVLREKGYAFFTKGEYNMNIIGVRAGRVATDRFDDTLMLMYKVGDVWNMHWYPCTTDPGLAPLGSPGSRGRAVLAPGQYRGAYALGLHKGNHMALRQVKPVTVYRDRNGDNYLDYEHPETGMFGINIHWSSRAYTSEVVGSWSEGCQVGAGAENYKEFIGLLSVSADLWGNSFTYTLLEATDFLE